MSGSRAFLPGRRRPCHRRAGDGAALQRAQQGEVVTLADRTAETVVTIVPSVGNIAVEMKVKGHNVLRYPQGSVAEFKARPGATGIPFMGPWANRLDEQAFYANGRRHAFDMALGNVRGEVPIHGFVTTTNLWRVTSVAATRRRRVGDQQAGVLQAAGLDAPMALRAHHRHDLPVGRRRAGSVHHDRQPQRRADAGLDRLPPLFPADGLTARRVGDLGGGANPLGTGCAKGADRRHRSPPRRSSRSRA